MKRKVESGLEFEISKDQVVDDGGALIDETLDAKL